MQTQKLINNSDIPLHEIEIIARIPLSDILAYCESEKGQREFAAWKASQDAADTVKDSNHEKIV